jgi:putative zinc finger/helix-turn-helix YgiT family protein
MKCLCCENKKALKKSKSVYKYKDCGLNNVVLFDITIMKCENCGEEYLNFGNTNVLHDTIATILLQKHDLLIGKEIRFLRKHLGYSGVMFANLIGFAHETLSRIENGSQKVTASFDHLIRFAVANKFSDHNYDLHDHILNKKGKKLSRIELKQTTKGEWQLKKAA